jgi:hypothetical protein
LDPKEIAKVISDDPVYQVLNEFPTEILLGMLKQCASSKPEDYTPERIEGLIGMSELAIKMVIAARIMALAIAKGDQ